MEYLLNVHGVITYCSVFLLLLHPNTQDQGWANEQNPSRQHSAYYDPFLRFGFFIYLGTISIIYNLAEKNWSENTTIGK